MSGLYIASTTQGAGKSLLTLSLGLMLKECGLSLGYMKPLGSELKRVEAGNGDIDALVTQEVLGLDTPPEKLSPVMIPQNWIKLSFDNPVHASPMEHIQQAYAEISRGKDLTLVGGTGVFPYSGHFGGINGLDLLIALELKLILIERFEQGINYDALIYFKQLLGSTLIGTILNDIPASKDRDIKAILVPYLEQNGLPVLGVIPREPRLNSIRIIDLSYALNGRIVAGNNDSQRRVEGFLIGTMQVENFMTYLRGAPKSAVIVGGDRSDLQLAALYGNAHCIILTGNIGPDELIRSKAEARGVPVIVVKEDSYTVARRMDRILRNTKVRGLEEIRIGAELVKNSINAKNLCNILEV